MNVFKSGGIVSGERMDDVPTMMPTPDAADWHISEKQLKELQKILRDARIYNGENFVKAYDDTLDRFINSRFQATNKPS